MGHEIVPNVVRDIKFSISLSLHTHTHTHACMPLQSNQSFLCNEWFNVHPTEHVYTQLRHTCATFQFHVLLAKLMDCKHDILEWIHPRQTGFLINPTSTWIFILLLKREAWSVAVSVCITQKQFDILCWTEPFQELTTYLWSQRAWYWNRQ